MSVTYWAATSYEFTTGRFFGTVAVMLAVAGVLVAGIALARARRRPEDGKRGAVVALAAGVGAIVVGGVVVLTADGGPGTGHGIVGGFVGLVLGLAATGLGGWVINRSRRAPTTTPH